MSDNNTIPLPEAQRRTKNWQSFLSSVQTAGSAFSTKAVFISKEDIAGLSKICENDPIAIGVRAYFALDTEPEDAATVNSVRLVIVPVVASKDNPYGGKDIMNTAQLTGTLGGEDESTIYDFTKPCPDYCDPESDLF